jgi:holo-[acyl-carrier protein] synthase
MVYGVGTDICDVRRIRRSTEKFGARFASKILHDSELAVWQERSLASTERGLRYLATRFAAKEALSKSIGLGMQWPMTWHGCEIRNTTLGAPYVCVHGALKDWCDARHLVLHMSVSDERHYVVAFCVAEVQVRALI